MRTIVVAAFLVCPALAQEPVDSIVLQKERSLGAAIAHSVRGSSKALGNPEVDQYVSRIGQQVAARLEGTPQRFTFEVVVSEYSGPRHFPGGFIFVSGKALLSVRDESELAGMLSHSIGHVALRHGARKILGGTGVNSPAIPLVYAGGSIACAADPEQRNLVFPALKNSQGAYELEADKFALDLTARAGYDARAYRRYVERSEGTAARLTQIDEALGRMPASQVPVSDEFKKMQEHVRAAVGLHEKQAWEPPTLRRTPKR